MGASFANGDDPNKLNVEDCLTGGVSFFASGTAFGALKNENDFAGAGALVGDSRLIVPARAGTLTSFFGAGFEANKLMLPGLLGTLTSAFFSVEGAPKKENAGEAGDFAGTGAGETTFFAPSKPAVAKKEKLGDGTAGFFIGAGAGADTLAGGFDGVGKKENGVEAAGLAFLTGITVFFCAGGVDAGVKKEKEGVAGAAVFFTTTAFFTGVL